MKKVQIEFDELPFSTLERFGLTREMIEDLPMRVLDHLLCKPESGQCRIGQFN